MGEVTDRTGYPNVAVDIERVRASGLVKDEIGLAQPDEKGTFSTTLLREAVKATRGFEERWAAYSSAEGEPEVLPVLVVQVPDKASDAKLTELVGTIEEEWPGLGPRAIAHVLGEHERLTLGSRSVEWVYPESIQTETEIRVVLAKEAISTGWDCPRAEVLYSERPAKDATHIAQIIGRMVRQPLAHRIATDDALNSVTCYLPLFDKKALTAIKDELEGKGAENGQNRVGATVVRAPMVFERNAMLDPAVFAFIDALPSIPTPDRTASPLRRARKLARLLADDAAGAPLLADAGAALTARLNSRLDGRAAEFKAQVDANVEDLLTTVVATTRVTTVGEDIGDGPAIATIATHSRDVARDAQRIIDSVREGVGKAWFAASGDGRNRRRTAMRVRVRCAALLRVDGVAATLDATATEWVKEQLDRFRVEILNTVGATARRLHAGAGADFDARRSSRSGCARTSGRRRRTGTATTCRAMPGTSSPTLKACSPSISTTGSARSSRRRSPGRASWRGIGTRGARRRRRCGSPTRTTKGRVGVPPARLHRRVAAHGRDPWRIDRRPARRLPRGRASEAPGAGGVRRAVR